jgi:tetratricopeptide (TPR) repeat protein
MLPLRRRRFFTGHTLAVSLLLTFRLCNAEDSAAKAWRADMKEGNAAKKEHRLFDAAKFFDAAVKDAEKSGSADERLAESLRSLGRVDCDLEKYQEGQVSLRRCVALDEHRLGINGMQTLLDVVDLAAACGELGQYEEADALYRRAQEGMAARYGPYDRNVGICLVRRGALLAKQGRLQEAESIYQQALRLIGSARVKPHSNASILNGTSILAPDPVQMAGTLVDLGLVYRRERKFEEAESSFKQAIEFFESCYGKSSVKLVVALNDLALVYADQRLYPQAVPLLERSIRIMESSQPDNSLLLESHQILDQVRRAQGKTSPTASR